MSKLIFLLSFVTALFGFIHAQEARADEAADQLLCVGSARNSLYAGNTIIGTQNGFGNRADCERARLAAQNGIVCANSGSYDSYRYKHFNLAGQTTDISGIGIGDHDGMSLDACITGIQQQQDGIVCERSTTGSGHGRWYRFYLTKFKSGQPPVADLFFAGYDGDMASCQKKLGTAASSGDYLCTNVNSDTDDSLLIDKSDGKVMVRLSEVAPGNFERCKRKLASINLELGIFCGGGDVVRNLNTLAPWKSARANDVDCHYIAKYSTKDLACDPVRGELFNPESNQYFNIRYDNHETSSCGRSLMYQKNGLLCTSSGAVKSSDFALVISIDKPDLRDCWRTVINSTESKACVRKYEDFELYAIYDYIDDVLDNQLYSTFEECQLNL